MNHSSRPTLAVIAGPTASGKSALALSRALAGNGVIINADASQIYADLQILTARPSAEEMAQAPHRLYGVQDGAKPVSGAQWCAMAQEAIEAAWAAGRLPILVGGTGLYLRLLLEGLAPVPAIDPDIRAAVRALPLAQAYAALEQADPLMAARLHPSDTTRVQRALEVVRATGQSLAHFQQATPQGLGARVDLQAVRLLPDRDTLYARCDARFVAMVAQGALEEVEALAARGLDPQLPIMRALGVAPLMAYLQGEISLDEAIALGQQQTRNYAKRQYTWFRNQFPDWPIAETSA